jgi:hypothetical protein
VARVSVICIAVTEDELAVKSDQLRRQSFKDFEFVGEAGGTIPQAWNRAIARARGEILVFTETDARPVNERWLEELVGCVTAEDVVVKGLEVTGQPWDMSNLACHRSAMEGAQFDERFRWSEDTEFFCRLKALGYELRQVPVAPVIHLRKAGSKRMIRRAFRYGMYQARLRHWYGDPVMIAGTEQALKRLAQALMNLAGLAVGYLAYLPERDKGRKHTTEEGGSA